MSRARDLADSADKDIAGTLTVDGLTVDTTGIVYSGGNVGIGTAGPVTPLHISGSSDVVATIESTDRYSHVDVVDSLGGSRITNDGGNLRLRADNANAVGSSYLTMEVDGSEAARIDSSGNVLVGTDTTSGMISGTSNQGAYIGPEGRFVASRSGDVLVSLNRVSSDGEFIQLRQDGTTVGSIGCNAGYLHIGSGAGSGAFLGFGNNDIYPATSIGGYRDNIIDLGVSSSRFDDIYATNGTIQTSDANEKQQIASLTDAEMTAAKAISQLFKTFKWNDAVAEKGDAARTHTGVIAQDVQQAMTDAGLDAGDYAFFISSTWWETQTEVHAVAEETDEDGNVVTEAKDAYTRTDTYDTAEEAPEGATERTRLGVRYPELLAFIGAATEQRLANIETRLEALEAN